ncbi:hypothetical protein MPER_03280 [Moniliophthora perniciosa FA553]|nr:hypothetical protein MPER_03280 [Moniliophthora perniciosa FA553]
MDQNVVQANATVLMTHLLFGIAFIHKNFIAHLDIRPHNLVVCQSELRLEIIDFSLAITIKNQNALVQGFRGYLPWVAPEVKAGGYFCPIAADLWACGRVLELYRRYFEGDIGQCLADLSIRLIEQDVLTRILARKDGMKKLRSMSQ